MQVDEQPVFGTLLVATAQGKITVEDVCPDSQMLKQRNDVCRLQQLTGHKQFHDPTVS